MPISCSMTDTQLKQDGCFSDDDLKFLGLDSDGVLKVGIEFMSFMNQRPNDADGDYVLTEELAEPFAQALRDKGYKMPIVIVSFLVGAVWSRRV